MKIPENFILNKFYQFSYDPIFRKHDGVYNAGCPVCKEGKSLGKKKRLFYYPESSSFYCFNCSRSWDAFGWLRDACNMSRDEIYTEIETEDFYLDISKKLEQPSFIKKELPDLPHDAINLSDKIQNLFYANDKNYNAVYDYAKSRKLFTAVNKSPNLFVSLTDFIHKNRLCIPFYDINNKVVFYQTRAVDKSEPRYLGKRGYDKTIFGIDRIDPNIPYIFIFEGPIDAMFVRNGVSAAGLTLTNMQENQLSDFPFHKKIWVLDNPNFDNAAISKITELIQNKQKVFKWKPGMSYKDFNEMALFEDLDEINYQLIVDNLY